jgi:5'-phosphate synthase pdxT subunit
MLAEQASATKQGGQELIGGLDVRVLRNRYGSQVQSFVAELELPFLDANANNAKGEAAAGERTFRGVFIRAPVVEEIIAPGGGSDKGDGDGAGKGGGRSVEVLGVYRKAEEGKPGEGEGEGDIVAVRQGNVFGTSFHPELTDDVRIHVWWLRQVVEAARHGDLVVGGA